MKVLKEKGILYTLFILLLSFNAYAKNKNQVKAYFSPHQGQKAFVKMYDLISKTKTSASITVYSWSDKGLNKAIKTALSKEDKPKIRLVLSPHLWRAKKEKLRPQVTELELMGAEFKVAIKDMHEKFSLIDDITLINTSANFSLGARTRYSENFIFHTRKDKDSPYLQELFSQFKNEFKILWNTGKDIYTHDEQMSEKFITPENELFSLDSKTEFFSSSMNFSLKENLPPSKRLLQGRYFSLRRIKDQFKQNTWTVRDQLLSLIKNAKHSIKLGLNHLAIEAVSDALIEATQRGIDVKFVVDNQEFRRKAKKSALMAKFVEDWKAIPGNDIKDLPVRVKYYSISPNPIYWFLNHHKFILIDYKVNGIGTKLYSGSYNISRKAEHNQFDNMVLYDDPSFKKLYTSFNNEFNHLWKLNRPSKELSEQDYLKLIEGSEEKLIVHFFRPISLSWHEIQTLRRLFVKKVDIDFWKELKNHKQCRYYIPTKKKFSGCKF